MPDPTPEQIEEAVRMCAGGDRLEEENPGAFLHQRVARALAARDQRIAALEAENLSLSIDKDVAKLSRNSAVRKLAAVRAVRERCVRLKATCGTTVDDAAYRIALADAAQWLDEALGQ